MITTFERPTSVDQALAIRDHYGEGACWAGGWALAGRGYKDRPIQCAISLEDIRVNGASLAGFHLQGDLVRLGAMTSLQDICDAEELPQALRTAAAMQPSRALRCMTTVGGDVAARRDDACLPTALTALGTVLELAGDSVVTADNYGLQYARDLILFARVPQQRRCALARHRRSSRGAVLVTAAVGWNEDGSQPIVALSGAGLPLQRLYKIEELVAAGEKGQGLEKAVRAALSPLPHWTGSDEFRIYMAAVAISDCVDACHQGRVWAC